jgi:hypothetical protein
MEDYRKHLARRPWRFLAERVGFEPTVRLPVPVFEFYDSHAGLCHAVVKRVPWFGIFDPIILASDAPCRFVLAVGLQFGLQILEQT